MPALDETFWKTRTRWTQPCHYNEFWQDLYARTVRRAAVERLFPCYDVTTHTKTARVLDVGCGDGRFGEWVSQRFDVEVTGMDVVEYDGVRERLFHFERGDAERAGALSFQLGTFDVALLITVLPFVRDWGKALQGLMNAARFVLIVDNLQFPPPAWQEGLAYKQHIPLPQLLETADALGYAIDRVEPVNVLDRRLFLAMPQRLYALAFGVTTAVDLLLVRLVRLWVAFNLRTQHTNQTNTRFRARFDYAQRVRYWAVLLRNPLQ